MSKDIPLVAFRVPNTTAGIRWVKDARKYVNRDRYTSVLARPRGNGCKVFGVYLHKSNAVHKYNKISRSKYAQLIKDYDIIIAELRKAHKVQCQDTIHNLDQKHIAALVRRDADHDIAIEDIQKYHEVQCEGVRNLCDDRIAVLEEIHKTRISDEHMLCDRLMRTLHNWQIGTVAAFLGGLAIGMAVVGMICTNAAQ
jgi:hypothetical protein